MAEEEELYDLAESEATESGESTAYWTSVESNNAIFIGIIAIGLAAHILIIYTMATSKRVRSRTNIIIMNWIIFEMVTHNLIYPLVHFWHVYEYSYVLHMFLGNVLLATVNASCLFLNILLSDSIMISNDDPAFAKFMERLYATLATLFVFVLLWKMIMISYHHIYIEMVLIVVYVANALALLERVLWKQSVRIVRCKTLNANMELRLHIGTLFICSKMLTVALSFGVVAYKSVLLMTLSKFWCLSGLYILGLLIAKDLNFKIGLCEALGLNVKHPNDADNIIRRDRDEEGDDNFIETCIQTA